MVRDAETVPYAVEQLGHTSVSNIYFYKLTRDDGGAPCVRNGILSLAICKPFIRASAKVGDTIFGFAANSLSPDNPLIYIARVTGKLCNSEYYKTLLYKNRSDCIYEAVGDGFARRSDAKFDDGPEHLVHDLGQAPRYERANVLLSDDFRYFGDHGLADYKREFPHIKYAVEQLARGHRVHLSQVLREEFERLAADQWKQVHRKVAGRPMQAPSHIACHRGRSCGVIPVIADASK
jgi:hypothetical protein